MGRRKRDKKTSPGRGVTEVEAIQVCGGESHSSILLALYAYNANSMDEWLSPPHTWIASTSVTPRPGDVFLSRFRRPMLKMIEDGGDGIHDMLLPACDQFRYEFFGYKGPHPNCSDNLMNVMRRRGHEINVIPQPINFFTNTNVQNDGSLIAIKLPSF